MAARVLQQPQPQQVRERDAAAPTADDAAVPPRAHSPKHPCLPHNQEPACHHHQTEHLGGISTGGWIALSLLAGFVLGVLSTLLGQCWRRRRELRYRSSRYISKVGAGGAAATPVPAHTHTPSGPTPCPTAIRTHRRRPWPWRRCRPRRGQPCNSSCTSRCLEHQHRQRNTTRRSTPTRAWCTCSCQRRAAAACS